ncbi:MAG TPA: hypothetical protein VGN44_10650 [Candidatus Angelobacter sp.]|jgi:DNA-directed RNA polymerase specialized sigma24 family protein
MIDTRTKVADPMGHAEFEAFYGRTARALHGYLCRLCGDAATSDEILQEAYIRSMLP